MTRSTFIAAGLALAAVLPAIPAQAAGSLTRTFVSSAGHDSNPCTITQPCATFAVAYAATAANGIVAALDPGKYGPLTIMGPVTVNGYGWAAITGPASGNAITINAVSGNVTLTGLEIDGAGAANNGIQFNSGGSLTIRDSEIQNFAGNGVNFLPAASSSISVSRTLVGNNGGYGILVQPSGSGSVTAVFDHVEAQYNGAFSYGIALDGHSTSGLVNGTVTDSVSSNNGGGFIVLSNGTSQINGNLMVMRSLVANNHTGLQSTAGAGFDMNAPFLRISQTIVTNNVVPCAGLVQSYQDNTVNNNQQQDTCGEGPIQKE